MTHQVIELRQYTLHPGRRDELVELFDREFVETQEATGMAVLGQFRDLDNPDRFVWLRSFPDMDARKASLAAFYGGPVWKEHRDAANATMIDSDDVLLLRPVDNLPGFPQHDSQPDSHTDDSPITATIQLGGRSSFLDDQRDHLIAAAGVDAFGFIRTEYATNSFPALPVRTGEHAFVSFTHHPNQPVAIPGVRTQRLRLSPTPRSRLR